MSEICIKLEVWGERTRLFLVPVSISGKNDKDLSFLVPSEPMRGEVGGKEQGHVLSCILQVVLRIRII